MKRRMFCQSCGHSRTKHYDPITGSDRNMRCNGALCKCTLTQNQVERAWLTAAAVKGEASQ